MLDAYRRQRCPTRHQSLGAVAQLGERLVRNEQASGSIPLSSTRFLKKGRTMQARNTQATARPSVPGASLPRPTLARAPARSGRASKLSAELLDKQLRQLTSSVLDALKNPAAIPSNVILAALKSARQI